MAGGVHAPALAEHWFHICNSRFTSANWSWAQAKMFDWRLRAFCISNTGYCFAGGVAVSCASADGGRVSGAAPHFLLAWGPRVNASSPPLRMSW